MLTTLLMCAHAATPEEVLARVSEISPLRGDRLTQGAPPIPEEMYREAAAGKVPTGLMSVEGAAAKKAYGVAIVDVPIDRLWAAINDDAGKLEVTRLSYAEILEGSACSAPRTIFQYLPTPMVLADRWWVVDIAYNHPVSEASGGRVREMRWKSDGTRKPTTGEAATWAERGVPLEFNEGAWLLIDLDGSSTLIEYFTWSDPGGNLPAGLVSSFSAGGISRLLEDVAQLARSGPGCPIQ
ncbi:MAG TPA: hypothetical protein ENK18_11235 [Deltaproteobacteria bacterium]|nr:hypothetical protein [Deltaproteobacteria bacterium]